MEVVSPLVGHEARALAGLHLFHYGLSNCSQKVRLVLAEKGVEWTSHWVDLGRGEHRTDAYRAVHPNGVVPALVDDGTIVIESSDIMEHLDERFPDPPLRPYAARELEQMRQWVARQDSIQRSFAVLSEEFFLPALATPPSRPSPSIVAGSLRAVEEALAEVNRQLGDRPWLVGDRLSLADVAWVVDVHRFALIGLPLWPYASLRRWYRRMRRLTSFQQAVVAYEPAGMRRRVGLYTLRRWVGRSDAGAARWRNPRLLAQA